MPPQKKNMRCGADESSCHVLSKFIVRLTLFKSISPTFNILGSIFCMLSSEFIQIDQVLGTHINDTIYLTKRPLVIFLFQFWIWLVIAFGKVLMVRMVRVTKWVAPPRNKVINHNS